MTWLARLNDQHWNNYALNYAEVDNSVLTGWNYFIASAMRKGAWIAGLPSSGSKANYPCLSQLYFVRGSGSYPTGVDIVPLGWQSAPANTPWLVPTTCGWIRTPAGWKRDRTHQALSISSNDLKNATKVYLSINFASSTVVMNGVAIGAKYRKLLAYSDGNIGLYGTTGKDLWLESALSVNVSYNGTFDLSFLDVAGLVPAPMKANKAFRLYLLMCCFWFYNPHMYAQGIWFGNGTATADHGVTINLRAGDINNVDVENNSNTDPILATYILGGDMFTVPDTLGRFALSSTQVIPVTATGTIGYAELLGGTLPAGQGPDGRLRMLMPVALLPTNNSMGLDKLNVTASGTVSLYDLGFQYKIADL